MEAPRSKRTGSTFGSQGSGTFSNHLNWVRFRCRRSQPLSALNAYDGMSEMQWTRSDGKIDLCHTGARASVKYSFYKI